eukprot:COSAG06_NODE_75804_length_127_cov_676.250000_1_plen_21_part_01
MRCVASLVIGVALMLRLGSQL